MKIACKSGMGHAAQAGGTGYRCSRVFSISSQQGYPCSFISCLFPAAVFETGEMEQVLFWPSMLQ